MLIVYSLLASHPASTGCEQFIRTHTGWFTTTFTLFEAKSILTKVYAADAALVSQKLAQFAAGPIVVVPVDLATALTAMNTADALGIDLTDAVLLQAAQAQGALWLATDDSKLAQACQPVGITPQTPIDATLRQQMAAWEAANLPAKGLPRVLRQVHQWLSQIYPQAAQDFWSQTGRRKSPAVVREPPSANVGDLWSD
jgi:predicted nucleic acid-binding protein